LAGILDRCTQYTLLPDAVTIYMYAYPVLRSPSGYAGSSRFAGFALPDGKTIVIAKRTLNEMCKTVAHELGHIEHLNVYPESVGWTDQACENYANTLEWYFDEESFQRGFTISQYISVNAEREIIRMREVSLWLNAKAQRRQRGLFDETDYAG
jgi:hypothetical protein